MAFFFIESPRNADTTTLLLDQDKAQDSRSERLTLRTIGTSERDIANRMHCFMPDESQEENRMLLSDYVRALLDQYRPNLADARINDLGYRASGELAPSGIGAVQSIDDVCSVLRSWGEYTLADRISYFASDEDLDDGDVPLTLDSAHGFLAFFSEVESDGRVGLACSQEGWICAEWRFPDQRRASLWFLDENRVMFAATDEFPEFIEIEGGSEFGYRTVIAAKLVEAGLLKW